jgi:hypothetical protein
MERREAEPAGMMQKFFVVEFKLPSLWQEKTTAEIEAFVNQRYDREACAEAGAGAVAALNILRRFPRPPERVSM